MAYQQQFGEPAGKQNPSTTPDSSPLLKKSTLPTSISNVEPSDMFQKLHDESNKAVRGSGSDESTSDGRSTDVEIIRTKSPFNEDLIRGVRKEIDLQEVVTMMPEDWQQLGSVEEGLLRGQEALLRYDLQARPEPPAAVAQTPRVVQIQRPLNPLKHRHARFGNRRKTGGLTRRSDGKSLATRAVNPTGIGRSGREISAEKVDQPGFKTMARQTASRQSQLLVSFSALTVGIGLVYYFCAWEGS